MKQFCIALSLACALFGFSCASMQTAAEKTAKSSAKAAVKAGAKSVTDTVNEAIDNVGK